MVWPYLLGVGVVWVGKKIYDTVTEDSSSSAPLSNSNAESAAAIRARELRARRKLAREEAAATLKLFLEKKGVILEDSELESIVEALSPRAWASLLAGWTFPVGMSATEESKVGGSEAEVIGSIEKTLMDRYMKTAAMESLAAEIDETTSTLQCAISVDIEVAKLAKSA